MFVVYQQVMREGYFGISRARYMLGIKRVSADQIVDAELSAKYTALCDDLISASDPIAKSKEHSISSNKFDKSTLFQLYNVTEQIDVDKSDNVEEISLDTDSDKNKDLRRRRINVEDKKDAKVAQEPDDDGREASPKSSRIQNSDPSSKREGNSLSLFGVLIPQPLRQSQKCFEEAVRISVTLADLRAKLSLLRRHYGQLGNRKRHVQDTSSEQ